ncbi:hypothetical protein [Streptomyces sp. CL12-4]|uniref:hypothetical protein n=1 Tax=Streptomyces sp. CL12-4 TaxID=2810306 RepID=UPI001EFA4DB4|nr:hypothetical protein [Streptomyces sp. CL12-4]
MSVRRSLIAVAAAVTTGFVLAAPAAANVMAADGDDGGSGRGPSLAALVVAVISVVLGVRALRAAGRGGGNAAGPSRQRRWGRSA